jgi:DNA repair protein RadC
MNNKLEEFEVTEVELIYRSKVKHTERRRIQHSQEAYVVLSAAWDENKIDLLEEFKVLLLDKSNRCLGVATTSVGGISSCLIDPKIVFATALKARASGIIVSHNHPSGNLHPSEEDLKLTSKLMSGGKYLEISVMDHIIMSSEGYYSMADEGVMPMIS